MKEEKRFAKATWRIMEQLLEVDNLEDALSGSLEIILNTLNSVDYFVNFFYSYNDPFGLSFAELWQWYLYLLSMAALATLLIFILYAPFIFKRKAKKEAPDKDRQNG